MTRREHSTDGRPRYRGEAAGARYTVARPIRCGVDPRAYRRRIGLEAPPDGPAREAVAALQAAHVRRVPFETLSVAGDPFGDREGEGVTLDPPRLY